MNISYLISCRRKLLGCALLTTTISFASHSVAETVSKPVAAPTANSAVAPLTLVHYMPWFFGPGSYHWSSTGGRYGNNCSGSTIPSHFCPDPSLETPYSGNQLYSCLDSQTVKDQIETMQSHGIDGITLDWYGAYPKANADYNQINQQPD
jgi:hypothetical protein